MEGLGGHQVVEGSARIFGGLAFVGILVLTALLERLQFQLRATEASAWWASNGRDVLNLFALGAMALGLRLIGFTGPIALCIAASLVIVLSTLQAVLPAEGRAGLFSALAALALGLPILLLPDTVHRLFRGTLETLFP